MKSLLLPFLFGFFAVATSAFAVDTMAPNVPQDLIAVKATSTSITLQWMASKDDVGVTAYEVFRDGVSQGTATGTSKLVSGLNSGVSYQFTVRARDAAGNWSYLGGPKDYHAAGAWSASFSGSIYSQDEYDDYGNYQYTWVSSDYYSRGVSQPGALTATLNGFYGALLGTWTGDAFYNNWTYVSDAGDGAGNISISRHTVDTPGLFNVGIMSQDQWSTGGYELTISFEPDLQSPSPYFDHTALSSTAPATASFDANGSVAAAGATVASYSWDFQNDATFHASGVTANHAYTIPAYFSGYFVARLKVTGSNGIVAYTSRKLADLSPPAAPANPRVSAYGTQYGYNCFTVTCDPSSDNIQTAGYYVYNSSGTMIGSSWGSTVITLYSWNASPPCTVTMRAYDSAYNVSADSQPLFVPAPSAPSIATQPQSQSVSPGQAVTFSVGVGGAPTLTHQWRKSGVNIFGATNATLAFSNVQSADNGSYSVVVTNYLGSATSGAATLTVNSPPVAPTIAVQPQSQTINSGLGKTIAAGGLTSYAVKTNGSVGAWGNNDYGQLGLNTLSGAVAVTAGCVFAVALKSDGTVWAAGENTYGSLGNNSTANSFSPVQVSNLGGVVAVAAGYRHTLALKGDGTVWSWGYNYYGQLGDGSTTTRLTPVPVQFGEGVNIVAIASGSYHCLALQSNGTVWVWGNNGNGQLGDGTTIVRTTPVAWSGPSGITALAGGENHSVALKSDGTVWTWGANYWGQLGDRPAANPSTPAAVASLSGITAIAAGYEHSFALKNNGTGWGSGYNGIGELGDGTDYYTRVTPVITGGANPLSNIVAQSTGAYFSMALRGSGEVWTWGSNHPGGQLGYTTPNSYTTNPGQIAGVTAQMPSSLGGIASFSVAVTGSPAPTLQWRRKAAGQSNFTNLTTGAIYSGGTGVQLSVNGLTAAMNGDQFQCVVTNSVGTATSALATLTLSNTTPEIASPPVNVITHQGMSATFSVGAVGSPTPVYQWRKNGNNLGGASASILTIANAQLADAGSYTVAVSNTFGTVISSPATLSVIQSPVITSPLTASGTYGAAFAYTITATNSPTMFAAIGLAPSVSGFRLKVGGEATLEERQGVAPRGLIAETMA